MNGIVEKRFWIGWSRVRSLDRDGLRALLAAFGDLAHAWNASSAALRNVPLLRQTVAEFLTVREECDLNTDVAVLDRVGAWLITWSDPNYPRLLRYIHDPPLVLYVKGTLIEDDAPAVAVVGTRRATPYGTTMTRLIASTLAQAECTVVSGLARGIDAMAHRSAIAAGGRTLAVMATGIDRVYPAEHQHLAEAIAANGALISELPPGELANSYNFPRRNRIISGLGCAVVVVEAGEKSGALITVDHALDQGREVFAIPGDVLSFASKGTNRLIQDGAQMITSGKDLINKLIVLGWSTGLCNIRDAGALDT
jgi:DNA processing protein